MKFCKLFEIEVLHDYYKNGLCPDFIIEPSDETNRILRNHRFQVRTGTYGVSILASTGEDGEIFLALEENQKLTFYLRLISPSFVNYTDLEGLTGEEIPYYSNKNINSNSDNELKRFMYGQSNSIASKVSKDVFGIVDIYVDRELMKEFSKQKLNSYKVAFNSKKIKWKYYLVTEKSTANNFEISDADNTRSSSPIVFKNMTSGKQKTDDVVSAILERQFPDKQKIIFESADQISYSQEARKNLQLKQNETILVEHLPNPSPDLEPYRIIKNIK